MRLGLAHLGDGAELEHLHVPQPLHVLDAVGHVPHRVQHLRIHTHMRTPPGLSATSRPTTRHIAWARQPTRQAAWSAASRSNHRGWKAGRPAARCRKRTPGSRAPAPQSCAKPCAGAEPGANTQAPPRAHTMWLRACTASLRRSGSLSCSNVSAYWPHTSSGQNMRGRGISSMSSCAPGGRREGGHSTWRRPGNTLFAPRTSAHSAGRRAQRSLQWNDPLQRLTNSRQGADRAVTSTVDIAPGRHSRTTCHPPGSRG